jgi:hypothetical protein
MAGVVVVGDVVVVVVVLDVVVLEVVTVAAVPPPPLGVVRHDPQSCEHDEHVSPDSQPSSPQHVFEAS